MPEYAQSNPVSWLRSAFGTSGRLPAHDSMSRMESYAQAAAWMCVWSSDLERLEIAHKHVGVLGIGFDLVHLLLLLLRSLAPTQA